ncbi:MAG: hypothetical protein JSV52_04500 [Candidatus Zixiibacteriota bacterium]|nr:MAG: hypothetical protein JSV52_04500 [candidate division Zixibacteria bacterium]
MRIPRGYTFTKFFVLLVVCLGIIACLYALLGERVISDLYQGKLPFTSHSLFTSTPSRPVEFYVDLADKIIWEYLVLGLPLTILIWAFVARVLRFVADPSTNRCITSDLIPVSRFRCDAIVAFILYSLATVAISYRILGLFSLMIIGPPEDNLVFYWNFWFMNEHVLNDIGNLTFTNCLFFPEGARLYYHSWSFYNLGVSALISQFMNLKATYNLVALHSFPVGGLGAFLLVRHLTRNSYVALLAGFMYAFCPYHYARLLHHLNLSSIQFIPFFVLFYIKAIKMPGKRNIVLAAVFLLLNALCTWTYLIFALMFMFLSYVYLAIRRHRIFLHDVAVKSLVIASSVFIILLPWLWQMARLAFDGARVYQAGRAAFVTDVVGLFVPRGYHWMSDYAFVKSISSTFTGNAWEATTYLGIPAIVIVIIASFRILPALGRYLAAALAFLLLSFGGDLHVLGHSFTVVLPDIIISKLPLLSNVRAPSRYIVYVYLFWSILVSVAAGYFVYSIRSRLWRPIVAVLLLSLLVGDFIRPVKNASLMKLPSCYENILESGDRPPILDLPTDERDSRYYMFYQTQHGCPIVQGYIARKVDTTLVDRIEYDDLDTQKQQLVAAGVKYIMIHTRLDQKHEIPADRYKEAYRVVCEDENHILLEVH